MINFQISRTMTQQKEPVLQSPPVGSGSNKTWRIIRLIFLDLPLALSLTLFLMTDGIQRLYAGPVAELIDSYKRVSDTDFQGLFPELDTDVTYYNRQCTVEDISTTNSDDLIISKNATGEDAADLMMEHGAVLIEDLISQDTAAELREYLETLHDIQDDLPYMEKFFEDSGRLSLGLGLEDNPMIGKALEELGRNRVFKTTIEGILGEDPAVIEISTLTTMYGAEEQGLHTDSDFFGSSVLYSRTFLHSHTLFIALQDTTSRMGATTVCPGTHMCANQDLEDVCLNNGAFEVSTNGQTGLDVGLFYRGDGFLFNQNVWHRGAKNNDRNIPINRVNLILTFASRRDVEKGDVRQQGMGTYFYQRWNMWGHTFEDLKDATAGMVQPWAAMKALGLYKPSGSKWGITWSEHFARQVGNRMDFYAPDELPGYIDWLLSLKLLDRFLPDEEEDAQWEQYFEKILDKIRQFFMELHVKAVSVYIAFFVVANLFRERRCNISAAVLQAAVVQGLVCFVGFKVWQLILSSDLSKEIEIGLRRRSPFPVYQDNTADLKATTLPERADVLFGSRFDSEFLGNHNEWLDYHPGNRRFDSLVDKFEGFTEDLAFLGIIEQVAQPVRGVTPRFLKQDYKFGHWIVMEKAEVDESISRALLFRREPLKRVLYNHLKSSLADSRFGLLRDTIMAQKFAPPRIKVWEGIILGNGKSFSAENASAKLSIGNTSGPRRNLRLRTETIVQSFPKRASSGLRNTDKIESNDINFYTGGRITDGTIKVGDRVLARDRETGLFLEGTVTHIFNENWCVVENVYGEEFEFPISAQEIQKYKPMVQGDQIEVESEEVEGVWIPAKVTSVHPLGRYNVEFEDGFVEDNLSRLDLRFIPEFDGVVDLDEDFEYLGDFEDEDSGDEIYENGDDFDEYGNEIEEYGDFEDEDSGDEFEEYGDFEDEDSGDEFEEYGDFEDEDAGDEFDEY